MVVLCQRKVVAFGLSILVASLAIGCSSQQKQPGKPSGKTYVFWPSAPDEPRVQFLYSFNSSVDVQKAQSGMDEMLYGKREVLPIAKPYGVAMWQGKLYVCDVRTPGVTVLDLKKNQTRVVGMAGGAGIRKAIDIAVAADGFKYVADNGSRNVVVLDPNDKVAMTIAAKDFNPVSVAVYEGELYVADFTGQSIKVFDRATGKFLRKIGEPGPEDGQFVRPITVRVDPAGEVVTVDVLKCRVQKFTRDGKFLMAFGRMGNMAGDLARPKHFAFDKEGLMYIADAAYANVQVFDPEGKVVDFFGGAGAFPGSMDLPAGVFVDENPDDLAMFKQYVHPMFQAERLILVTNQFGNQRVSVYAQGRLKAGTKVADLAMSRAKVPGPATRAAPTTTGPVFEPGMPVPSDAPVTRPAATQAAAGRPGASPDGLVSGRTPAR